MTLKTRLFGKKIQGEALEKLLGVMGEKTTIFYDPAPSKWSRGKVEGKCTLVPVNDGIAVDLYIFREEIHKVDGTIPADHEEQNLGKKYLTCTTKSHIKGKIPYEFGDK